MVDSERISKSDPALGVGQLSTLAIVLEVTAPKPGNVHRSADFEDVTLTDFLAAAVAVGPILEQAAEAGVGAVVLAAVEATHHVAGTNTNLGTLLLLGPLAAVPADKTLCGGISEVLGGLTSIDSRNVYEAIVRANPGGIQRVSELDVRAEAPAELLQAMQAAAERDLVARQYVNGFSQVFQVSKWISNSRREFGSLTEAVVHSHVRLMAEYPDSLIARKCGTELATEAAARAARVLAAGAPGDPTYFDALEDLDFWLRSEDHRRNPGTTADLIAAGLYAGLREQHIQPPFD